MPAVPGRQFLSDPDGEAERFAAQLKSEAQAPPSRYQWQGHYWCAIKTGRWPNVTGWAEQRESQRIYGPRLEQLLADGVPEDDARLQASDYARAEMLTRTTARKEASDRLYSANRAAQNPSVPMRGVINDE